MLGIKPVTYPMDPDIKIVTTTIAISIETRQEIHNICISQVILCVREVIEPWKDHQKTDHYSSHTKTLHFHRL